ncbi:unnamed protein product [Oncorhynchus mykiss]|uniref:SoHo domain-containing protein n=1 Tax=Oncorhynchus mykiss TaxID=8022 RepID=A0A060VPB3_ONCMY|nr:unnamed protein product [Oncorhynchus mykiss]
MPIASRSSVNQPKDWYRSMFRQIHKKPEGMTPPPSPLLSHTPAHTDNSFLSMSASRKLIQGADYSKERRECSSHFDIYTQSFQLLYISNSILHLSYRSSSAVSLFVSQPQGQPVQKPQPHPLQPSQQPPQHRPTEEPWSPIEKPSKPSAFEESLLSELNCFEAELDSDIQGLERRLSQKKQTRRGRGEGARNADPGTAAGTGTTQDNSSLTDSKQPLHCPIVPTSAVAQRAALSPTHERLSPAPEAMEFPPKRLEKQVNVFLFLGYWDIQPL